MQDGETPTMEEQKQLVLFEEEKPNAYDPTYDHGPHNRGKRETGKKASKGQKQREERLGGR